ncbi:NAD(P)H-hydrate dehydratase [Lactobacillus ultunensis]|uniref:ADP-dependent (S)-NAD(P)H-hydrate dehydratase n=1 Tax=Lactobacillus ultunensis DSM 16047 TaxID=525365 RepID=C2EL65_9LACO|nr:NAD(P)H-hydrate dehydratase [Lactobacillus ultunensis]EEJ72715.1 YjeF domain protein [Lactobacillus ultunensis DSM 16047]KRL81285.1 carbohydrate kinase [Lactobacillus ultunensis DSM 16047]QQP29061.1 NAD(P)H-hydrate dehydratase [Lactobacillus ultunensis]
MTEITEDVLKKVIVKRESDTYKGNYGRILLIGGSENYGGAIIMATTAAVNSGAGLTAVATHPLNLTALHARLPEAMFIDWRDAQLADLIKKMDVVVCGPGLGMSDLAKQIMVILRRCTSEKQTVVLDASALDLIGQDRSYLPVNAGHLILTPHQMEWQRVSQIRIPFQTDGANIDALNQLIPDSNAMLVLKSNHTHVYDGKGQIFVNPIGNPGMATGGMGDTLAGIIGGFVAQFGPSVDTVLAAVYIHSLAGDMINKENYVVRPTEISKVLPKLMKKYSELS